ncbi:hypothetical protein chiPu_0007231 [Chiloscyllium punctatum]|uniref:Uncharacterized protein n=1 Tax=Chiloscyllium punctatum TaxID=137246 RepID=A0A401SEF2_CHIPU|nr:hypothetical protein [Chiloscyllium punctatum]
MGIVNALGERVSSSNMGRKYLVRIVLQNLISILQFTKPQDESAIVVLLSNGGKKLGPQRWCSCFVMDSIGGRKWSSEQSHHSVLSSRWHFLRSKCRRKRVEKLMI